MVTGLSLEPSGMKRLLLFLVALLTLPALADIEVGEIVINRKADSVNVRVNMHNPGPATARSPIMVTLFVRTNDQDQWREVKRWTNISKLAVGHRVSRDYFNDSPGDWDSAFNAPAFSVRATAVSSAGTEAEYEASFP